MLLPTTRCSPEIRNLPEVEVATECVEDNALVFYGDKQAMVTIKGVDDNFTKLTRINDLLYGEGEFALRAANLQYGVLGIRLAQQLGTGTRWKGFMRVFAPNREGQFDISNPASGFVGSTRCCRLAWYSLFVRPNTTSVISSLLLLLLAISLVCKACLLPWS